MIVENLGYLKIDDVLKLGHFSIYETNKKTHILIKNPNSEKNPHLYFPKKDRLPWKIIEGKKICTCKIVFDSKTEPIESINMINWNNGNQILAYQEFTLSF